MTADLFSFHHPNTNQKGFLSFMVLKQWNVALYSI